MEKQDKRIGNQFWRNVPIEKLGRPSKYKTPDELWNDVRDYFDHCDKNPVTVEEEKSSMHGVAVTSNDLRIPYTWEGMFVFLSVCNLDHYKTKNEFSAILTHIENIIRNQKFVGASIGIFNHSIIARDLGLMESSKMDITTGGEKINRQDLTPEQVKNISEDLEGDI